MMTDLIPWGPIVFVMIYGLDLHYTVTFRKKHEPPEGTPRWIYWMDVLCVWGVNLLLAAMVPLFVSKYLSPTFIEQWLETAYPILRICLSLCVLERFVVHYYYKFHEKSKK